MKAKKKWRNARWKIAKWMLTEDEHSLLWGIHKAVVKGYKPVDNMDPLGKGKEIYIRSTVDDVTDDFIICRNAHGYYYTVPKADVTIKQFGAWKNGHCNQCGAKDKTEPRFCKVCGSEMKKVVE